MPGHRGDISGYGLPLPPERRPPPGARQAKVPQVLARVRRAYPPPGPPTPEEPARPTPPIPRIHRTRREVPTVGTSDPRQILEIIATYARGQRTVILHYRKATDHDRLVVREAECYSLRYKISRRRGRARYLYAHCLPHGQIHSFLVANIVSVQGTARRFAPRWLIEFAILLTFLPLIGASF